MSALPPEFLAATETAVLESLSRLLATKQITAAQARSLFAAWRVEQASASEPYARYEVIRHWRKAAA